MQVIKGNKEVKLSKEDLNKTISEYNNVIIDLGTGDGRFIFKQASENPNNLYIGVDPSAKQLEVYSKEVNKRRLGNAMFVIGSIELFPEELFGVADYLYINLPWGTLLQSIVNPSKQSVSTLANILKSKGTLEITLGYQDESEPGETLRLELPVLNEELIKETIYPAFAAYANLELEKFKQIEKVDLRGLDTTWAKKLTFGNERPLYKLIFVKE